MNYVNYILKVDGVNPVTFNIEYKEYPIKNVVISISEKTEHKTLTTEMEIKFFLDSNIQDKDKTLKITEETVGDIINLLFTKVNGGFGLPRRGTYHINGEGIIATGEVTLYNMNTVDLPDNIADEMEIDLGDNSLLMKLQSDPYQRLYRAAMRTEDTIARFMFLYGTLLAKDPTQVGVDQLIKKVEPKVEERQTTNPHKQGLPETKYTWLRNQVGHTNINSDLNKVEEEISTVISKFSEIVKKIIS